MLRALELYTLAADQGSAKARCNLGYMYANGNGVEQDTLASEQGHADAQCNLGHMYQNGQGVEKDEKHAVKLYTLAAEQDHAMAQNNLGWSYHNELYEAATTTSGSQELHRSNLTFLIDQNNGTTPSHQKVREWYKKAVNNDAENQYLMGLAYERGTGVIQSFPKSKKWYEKAASQVLILFLKQPKKNSSNKNQIHTAIVDQQKSIKNVVGLKRESNKSENHMMLYIYIQDRYKTIELKFISVIFLVLFFFSFY